MNKQTASLVWVVICLTASMRLVGADSKGSGSARLVDFAGYSQCVLLDNENTRVVLCPQCGGRVLEYSWKGQNVLYLDHTQDGWTYSPEKTTVDPCGGRFDIGPETTIPKHPLLWFGPWKAAITGPLSARLTSEKDEATGVQLIRDFALDRKSSHLRCTQTIRNLSNQPKHWCHWSRTLAAGNGICIVPLNPESRFPKGYIIYGPGAVMNFSPEDHPNVRTRDGFLEIVGQPAQPKFGIDSYAGWLAYITRSDLLFVKRFPVYPNRVYSEMAAFTISIWYYLDQMCELEPIGPRTNIAPGESASFTEDWWLLPYDYPKAGQPIDLKAVAGYVKRKM